MGLLALLAEQGFVLVAVSESAHTVAAAAAVAGNIVEEGPETQEIEVVAASSSVVVGQGFACTGH